MAQKDNFAGGFLLGTLLGGVVGGIVGTVLANRKIEEPAPAGDSLLGDLQGGILDSEESIELARRRLEDKIAQLNGAIDEVRYQLGNVNIRATEIKEEE
jgi:hypothetical protein